MQHLTWQWSFNYSCSLERKIKYKFLKLVVPSWDSSTCGLWNNTEETENWFSVEDNDFIYKKQKKETKFWGRSKPMYKLNPEIIHSQWSLMLALSTLWPQQSSFLAACEGHYGGKLMDAAPCAARGTPRQVMRESLMKCLSKWCWHDLLQESCIFLWWNID